MTSLSIGLALAASIDESVFAVAFQDDVCAEAALIPVSQACRRHERDASAPAVVPCLRRPGPADPVGFAEWIHWVLKGSAGIARRNEFDGSTKPVAVVGARVQLGPFGGCGDRMTVDEATGREQ